MSTLPPIDGVRPRASTAVMAERDREEAPFAVLRVDKPSARIPQHPRSPTYRDSNRDTNEFSRRELMSRQDKGMRYGATQVGLPIQAPVDPISSYNSEDEINYLDDPQFRYERSKAKRRVATDFNILTAPMRPSLTEAREMDLNIGMNFDSLDYLEDEIKPKVQKTKKNSMPIQRQDAERVRRVLSRTHTREDAPRMQKKDGEEMSQREYEEALAAQEHRRNRIRAAAHAKAKARRLRREAENVKIGLDERLQALAKRTADRAEENERRREFKRLVTPRQRRRYKGGLRRVHSSRSDVRRGVRSVNSIRSLGSVSFANVNSVISIGDSEEDEESYSYTEDDSDSSFDERQYADGRIFRGKFDHYTDLGGKELRVLSRKFKEIGMGFGLSEDEFVDLFSRVLTFSEERLHWLFQKIDADADGVMTWNEFTGFLLASNETIQTAFDYPHPLEETPAQLGTAHRHMVDKVLCLPERNAVLTVGRDFALTMWDSTTFKPTRRMDMTEFGPKGAYMMGCTHAGRQRHANKNMDDTQVGIGKQYHDPREFLKQVNEGRLSLKSEAMLADPEAAIRKAYERIAASKQPKFAANTRPTSVAGRKCVEPAPVYTPWVTAICYNAVAEEVVVASVDGFISIYDSRGFHRLHQFRCEHVPTTVSVCDVFHHGQILPLDEEDTVGYVVGDDHGFVTGYCKLAPWNKLHQYSHAAIHKEHAPEIRRRRKYQRGSQVPAITISQAQHIPGLGVISADSIGMLVLCDGERWDFMRVFKGHDKEIFAYTYCPSNRILASGGLDRVVRVWNPFLGTPIANLTGHTAPIVDIFCNDKLLQFISVAEDKVIKLWDIKNLQCVQTLVDEIRHVPIDRLTAAAFDPSTQRLITAGSQVRVWPVDQEGTSMERRRKFEAGDGAEVQGSVVFVGFSEHFNLLVCVTTKGHVSSWQIDQQNCMYAFVAEHREEKTGISREITAACLDTGGKRVITGAHDGSIKKWNFNNGNLLYELPQDPGHREINCLQALDAAITEYEVVGGLWEGVMRFWPAEDDIKTLGCKETAGHRGDVTALAIHSATIATGGSDGRIILWEAESFKVRGAVQIPAPAGILIPIESITILPKHGAMIVGCADGMLHVVAFLGACELLGVGVENLADAACAMAVNEEETRLATANASGDLFVWSLNRLVTVNEDGEREGEAVLDQRRFHRRAHGRSITSITAIEAPSVFVTGCTGGCVNVWSWSGARIGGLSPPQGPYKQVVPYSRGTLAQVIKARNPEADVKQFGQFSAPETAKPNSSKLERTMKLREASMKNLIILERQIEEKKQQNKHALIEREFRDMTVVSLQQRLVKVKNKHRKPVDLGESESGVRETVKTARARGYSKAEESVTTPTQKKMHGIWRRV